MEDDFFLIRFLAIPGAPIMIYVAVKFIGRANSLMRNGIKVKALVVDMLREDDGDGEVLFRPVIQFEDEQRRTLQITYHTTTKTWRKGDILDIIYDPLDPEEARAFSYGQLYGKSALLFGVGAALIVEMLFNLVAT